MKKILDRLDLNPKSSVVIGSGVLQALKIRKSNDIDLVVNQSGHEALKKAGAVPDKFGGLKLEPSPISIGVEAALFWTVLGKKRNFDDLKKHSVIIDGVRYMNLDYIYRVKKSWLRRKVVREKDRRDVELMREYLQRRGDL